MLELNRYLFDVSNNIDHKSLASLSDIIFHSFSAVSHHNIQPRPLSDHHETGHYNM